MDRLPVHSPFEAECKGNKGLGFSFLIGEVTDPTFQKIVACLFVSCFVCLFVLLVGWLVWGFVVWFLWGFFGLLTKGLMSLTDVLDCEK